MSELFAIINYHNWPPEDGKYLCMVALPHNLFEYQELEFYKDDNEFSNAPCTEVIAWRSLDQPKKD